MKTTCARLCVVGSLSILLALASCGEAGDDGSITVDANDSPWPPSTLVAREGMAVLEIEDDEVLFEGVPFEGTVPIVMASSGSGSMNWSMDGRQVSIVWDEPRGTMEISVGELRFTVTRNGEEVEFDGRRARLADGAKRAVFTKDGGVEVNDRE